MLNEPVLVDTGAFLAVYNANDPFHTICTKQSENLPVGKVFTCWPVITEAVYMLRKYPSRQDHLLGRIESQEYLLATLNHSGLLGVRDVLDKYHDQQVDLADACLVHLAEREGIDCIFTVDRRHFNVFRKTNGEAFRLLPE